MIKSVILAAAVAMGIGGAAQAATVLQVDNYNLNLRYKGTTFEGVTWNNSADESGMESFNDLASIPAWISSFPYGSINIGDIIKFTATVTTYLVDPDKTIENASSSVCQIGPWTCHITQARTNSNNIWLTEYDVDDYEFSTAPGSIFTHSRWAVRDEYQSGQDGSKSYGYRVDFETSYFTVVPDLAPVPLPATAALMPIGIGALAMMRKRRKRIS